MRQKTPIQEAIDKVQSLKEIDAVINPIDVITTILKQMLEKEKEVMCEFAEEYVGSCLIDYPKIEVIFNQTFKTKE